MLVNGIRDLTALQEAGFGRELRNFLRLKFSEMQSSAFWTLKFSKCLYSILNMYSNSYGFLTCNAEIFNKPQVWLWSKK